jgi:hypothetical protein
MEVLAVSRTRPVVPEIAPAEVWDRFRSTVAVAPVPVGEELHPLAIRYRFGPSRVLTLRARLRIPLGPNNYPVMIAVTAPGPK